MKRDVPLLILISISLTISGTVTKNLAKITWVHAVNNQSYLDQVLQEKNFVDMIEADVVMGHLINEIELKPIMAHPPHTSSDLSLEDFLYQVHNFNSKKNITIKGIKLDFKSIEAFTMSVASVKKYDNVSYPLWINADILTGPVFSQNRPVDTDKFLEKALTFPQKTVLSIGWTTNWGVIGIPPNLKKGAYEESHINKMLDEIDIHQVSHEITFPVRAGIVANSLNLMQGLLQKVPNSTLTIWSSPGDFVDVKSLRHLITVIGIDKIYIDVPEDLKKQLFLENLYKALIL